LEKLGSNTHLDSFYSTYFEEYLKEARTHAGLSQPELAEKVGVDKSYISKLERGVESPPSRKVAVKLADAVGMSNKPVSLYVSTKDSAALERFIFLLEANVVSAEDVQAIGLINVEDSEAEEEEEKESGITTYSAGSPGLSIRRSLPSSTTGGKVDRLIASGRFSEEEEKEVEAAVIELINRFISFKETQRKLQVEG
jgi:transcriptional regulator with XRE-family HTH domain